jgi:hypothetical protein
MSSKTQAVTHESDGEHDMLDPKGAIFQPEQLGAIGESFDEAREQLRQSGRDLSPTAAEDLAALMLRLGANGLSGEDLVRAAVRALLGQGSDD